MGGYLDAYFDLFRTAAAAVARERMQAAADAIIDVVAHGGTVFSCGNGGSAAIAAPYQQTSSPASPITLRTSISQKRV